MSRFVVLILALLTAAPLHPAGPPPGKPPRLDAVRRGMTTDEVRNLLGDPPRKARQILFRRYLEQWHYDDPAGWVEFQVSRGEQPFVLGVYPAKE